MQKFVEVETSSAKQTVRKAAEVPAPELVVGGAPDSVPAKDSEGVSVINDPRELARNRGMVSIAGTKFANPELPTTKELRMTSDTQLELLAR